MTRSPFNVGPSEKCKYTVAPIRKSQGPRSPCTACGRRKDWCNRAKPVCYFRAVEGRSCDYPLHIREANGGLDRKDKAKALALKGIHIVHNTKPVLADDVTS
jgi:hypothetical protein